MKKTLSLFVLFLLALPMANASDPSVGFDFYKKELASFPADSSREIRAYAKSLALGLNTWAWQNEKQPAVKDALLMQTRLFLQAQEEGEAFVSLFRLRRLFPETEKTVLEPLLAEAIYSVHADYRSVASNLFAADASDGNPTFADREAQVLYHLSKLSGKQLYAAGTTAFESFFVRYPDYVRGDQVELWYGDFHRMNGNYRAAISQYKKAGTLYPNTPYKAASLRLIGDIYADNLKDTAKATEAYTRVLRDFEGSAETGIVYKHMAIMEENNKQYDSALINYDKSIELLGTTPASYGSYRGKADVYTKTKDYEQAYNTLLQTAKLFVSDEQKGTDSFLEAAKVAQKNMHDTTKYVQTLEKALLAYPKGSQAPEIMYDLGKGYEDLGKTAQAIETYKKLIVAYPTNKLSSRAQGRLTKLQK